MTTITTNGAAPPVPVVASAAPAPAVTNGRPAPAPGAPPGPPGPAPDRAAEVMGRYQTVMQQFLETQRDVMLSYLGAPRPAGSSRPIASPAPIALSQAPAPALPVPVAAVAPVAPPAPAPAPASAAVAVAPPAPMHAMAPPVSGDEDVTLTQEELERRLLDVVSERTGYPTEMLSLDGDLEGDLGIDSIKRVEIAGTLTQGLSTRQRAAIDMEQLSTSRTLREVVEAVQASLTTLAEPPLTTAGESHPFSQGPADTERVGRFAVQVAGAPAIIPGAGPAGDGAIVIIGDGSELGAALATSLSAARHRAVLLIPDPEALDAPGEAAALAERLRAEHDGVKAVIHLAAPEDADADGGLGVLFSVVQALRDDLERAARQGGAAVLATTRLGGTFGISGELAAGWSGHGAIAGFVKSLALEWPLVQVKVVDLPADAQAGQAAGWLTAEFGCADGLAEIGYRDGERIQPVLVPTPVSSTSHATALERSAVLLVTGGGRGITAQVALELAQRHRCTLILVGRTPQAPEPPQTASLTEIGELRTAMIEARRASGEPLTPALVEADCRRILHGRELAENLAAMTAAGAQPYYVQCDVSDDSAFAALIDDVYARHGRIDGVIHGAGVIADGLVADKRRESLDQVMAVKAGSARTLARTLRPEGLSFLVLFGSVSGRFGNRGQADYAAASEVLNKLAQELDRRWAARVVCMNWGPWRAAGMVSPALEAEFARRGIVLIEGDEGCRMLAEEIDSGRKGETEVVIGAATGLSTAPAAALGAGLALLGAPARATATDDGGARASRSFTVERDRFLDDHRVDGRPVLPFTVAMETMAEVAAAIRPDSVVRELREIRVLKGITVPEPGAVAATITATPGAASGEFEVTISSTDRHRLNYRANVAIGDGPMSAAAAPVPEALTQLRPFAMTTSAVYRDLLFHGPMFEGIVDIAGLDQRGCTATLRGSDPERCVAGADGRHWLLDPVLLDSALQVQVVWGRLEWEVTLLPAQIGGYARYDDPRPGEAVRHELRIRSDASPPMCHADHWFYGADGRLLATLSDVVGVGSRALNRLAETETVTT